MDGTTLLGIYHLVANYTRIGLMVVRYLGLSREWHAGSKPRHHSGAHQGKGDSVQDNHGATIATVDAKTFKL